METAIWMSYIAVAVLTWYPAYEWLAQGDGFHPSEVGLVRFVAAIMAVIWPVIVPVWGAWHLSRLTWLWLQRRIHS